MSPGDGRFHEHHKFRDARNTSPKNPASALIALQAAAPIEFGQIPFIANLSCLYPTYVRGEVYLAAGQGKEAADEFQKILDHSGIGWNAGRERWRTWA